MECIVFDTSFLMNAVKARVDFFHDIKMKVGPFEAIIPSPVMDELNRLKGSDTSANVAVELLKQRPHQIVQSEETADFAVTQIAFERKCWVATTDAEVRRKAKLLELKQVTLREGKYIQM
ncbi:MAG: hypothetical protein GOV01_02135 [Candidatus Altiarchaeota archaeon]|nr:hypothetical protein [Candidatus Altiarchaeota archaeon]